MKNRDHPSPAGGALRRSLRAAPPWIPIAISAQLAAVCAIVFAAPAMDDALRFDAERVRFERSIKASVASDAANAALAAERDRLRAELAERSLHLDAAIVDRAVPREDGALDLRFEGSFDEATGVLAAIDRSRGLRVRSFGLRRLDHDGLRIEVEAVLEPIAFSSAAVADGARGAEAAP
jgi:hypothetical protein